MLASPFEAEDAVQETMLRAWRSHDRFEGRASLKSWLYRIATNVCLDMLGSKERRVRPMDLGPSREPVLENLNVAGGGHLDRSRPPTRPTPRSSRRRSGSRSSPPSSTCRRASARC